MRRKSLKENLKSLTPEQITEALKKAAEKAKKRRGRRKPITSTVDLGLPQSTKPNIRGRKLNVHECYRGIDSHLSEYENIKYLHDMKVAHRIDSKIFCDDSDQMLFDYCNIMRDKGYKFVRSLVKELVPADRVDEVYNHVIEEYTKEWDRFLKDKAAGLVQVGSEDYRKYSWRGNGPKPYFGGMIESYLKRKPKKYRSIDDPGSYIEDDV